MWYHGGICFFCSYNSYTQHSTSQARSFVLDASRHIMNTTISPHHQLRQAASSVPPQEPMHSAARKITVALAAGCCSSNPTPLLQQSCQLNYYTTVPDLSCTQCRHGTPQDTPAVSPLRFAGASSRGRQAHKQNTHVTANTHVNKHTHKTHTSPQIHMSPQTANAPHGAQACHH